MSDKFTEAFHHDEDLLAAIGHILSDPHIPWQVKRRNLARYSAVLGLMSAADRPQGPGLPWARLTPALILAAEAEHSDEEFQALAEEWFPDTLVMAWEPELMPQPLDQQQGRAQIERAVRTGSFAALEFTTRTAEALAVCTPADVTRLTVRAALTHLVGNGLVSVADEDAWQRFISSETPEPFWEDVRAELDDATARAARLNARLSGQGS